MDDNSLAHLEKLGYAGVLAEMAKGKLGQPGSQLRDDIGHWLKLKEAERSAVLEDLAIAREERNIAISERALDASLEANAISRNAKIWAVIAIVTSTLVAAISIYVQFIYKP